MNRISLQCIFHVIMKYPTTNKSLLERVQNGDEISWNEFFYRDAPLIRCAGESYRFNETECDDLVQAVMLKFFRSARTFVYREGQVKFRTWFSLIIRTAALDLVRRNARQKDLAMEARTDPDPFGNQFMEEWRKTVLKEAKDEVRSRVDPKTWQAFELYALQGRNADQVADLLELNKNQLYAMKNRCMAMLREIVARHNRADGDLNLEL